MKRKEKRKDAINLSRNNHNHNSLQYWRFIPGGRVLNLVFVRHFGFVKLRGGVKRVGRGRGRERN